MSKKKVDKQIWILIIAVIILLYLFMNSSTFSLLRFEEGFLGYGESPNQITDLTIIRTYADGRFPETTYTESHGKYWEFDTLGEEPSGDDFEISHSTSGARTSRDMFVATTTEYFNERIFKSKIKIFATVCQRSPCIGGGSRFNLILDEGDSQRNVFSKEVTGSGSSLEGVLEVRASPLTDKTTVFWAGQKVAEVTTLNKYKIKIVAGYSPSHQSGTNSQSPGTAGIVIKNPSYKSQFGCVTEPGEQTYVRIYKENQVVDINDFNNFRKFCLDELPVRVFTPSGVGTDKDILESIFNGEKFTVPLGQIWSIEYIGQKGTFQTACEEGLVYFENDNECLARTVVTFQCPLDSITSDGICVVETLPAPYVKTTIDTHQELLNLGKFRFTDILQDGARENPSSFILFDTPFQSNGVSYIGSGDGSNFVIFPEDRDNWIVSFSYNGNDYEGRVGDVIAMNEKLSVKISGLEAVYDVDLNAIDRFKIDYTFNLNTDFATLDYEPSKVILNNDFITFDGGMVITTTDKLGTTEIDKLERRFVLGTNNIPVDVTDIIELKARPFIRVEVYDFTYDIDMKNALIVKNPEDTDGEVIHDQPDEIPKPVSLIPVYIIATLLIIIAIMIFLFFIRRK